MNSRVPVDNRIKATMTVVIAVILSGMVWSTTVIAASGDDRVKALFIYNFANFVEWPDSAFDTQDSPLRLCLFGRVSFGPLLDNVDGTLIGHHALQIIRTDQLAEIASGCHMLFVSHEQRVRLPDFFTKIRYMYVLSIGEKLGFDEKGGIINIVRTADRMQFDINLSTAMANGLFVSSDLLSLAREVKRLDP